MFNTNFDLELEHIQDDESTTKETVKVTIQEISPFRYTDIMSGALNVESGQYNVGMLAERFIENVVVSPKDLKDQIEKCDNATAAITKIVTEVRSFCDCPKRYCLLQLQKQSKATENVLGDSSAKSNPSGNETANA